MLTATNIHKSFDGRPVLQGIDITLKPGTITCVIGPSGTGKTTLLRALALLDHPDQGSIAINDHLYDFPLGPNAAPPAPWPGVTVVFQSLFLWPHLTLRDNILLPARNGNSNAEKDLAGLARIFDMDPFIDRYPNQASIGQRQRAALVRALILNPHTLLLDEITASLDIEQTGRILTKLGHLRERGLAVLLITHQLNFARRSADHVVFMDQGRIAEQGAAAILHTPHTERLQQFLSLADLAV